MAWQPVPEGADVPAGRSVRLTYRIDVPAWLEWTPDFIMDWLMTSIGDAWARLQVEALVRKLRVDRYEVKVVKAGDIYEIVIYGTSRGVPVWAVAIAILGLIAVILYLVSVNIEKVEQFIEEFPAVTVAGLGVLILALLLLMRVRKPKEEERSEHGKLQL